MTVSADLINWYLFIFVLIFSNIKIMFIIFFLQTHQCWAWLKVALAPNLLASSVISSLSVLLFFCFFHTCVCVLVHVCVPVISPWFIYSFVSRNLEINHAMFAFLYFSYSFLKRSCDKSRALCRTRATTPLTLLPLHPI